jgi:preprotein translocase subunit SecD
MQRKYIFLLLIVLLVVIAVLVDLPNPPQAINSLMGRDVQPALGLDLRGGVQVLLQPSAGFEASNQNLQDASKILDNRSNALGVSEQVFQVIGSQYILGEFPGKTNTDQVVSILQQTGLLEFIDAGSTYLEPGTVVVTDVASSGSQPPSVQPTASASSSATPEAAPTETKVYHTVMTGADLKTVNVTSSSTDPNPYIAFTLTDSGASVFKDFTTQNVGKYLAIVLDKKVVSTPVIQNAITDGKGIIQGKYTVDSANQLATVLRFGSLPVPLEVAQSTLIGPSLGQDSLNKSITAGILAFIAIALLMLLYYRFPGLIATVALMIYVAISFAIFKLIPVTLTLPGIAGFVLSIGMAVDANVLIFERLKEELRGGRMLNQAIELGWKRAWLSIRDSNVSTLITCVILFWFGSQFGASIVKGFSLTLALGVLVSMFTAVVVTRSFLHLALDRIKFADHPKWFGL